MSKYDYEDALTTFRLELLSVHHEHVCTKLFQTVAAEESHVLQTFLPPTRTSLYDLRNERKFDIPKCNTKRFTLVFLWHPAKNYPPKYPHIFIFFNKCMKNSLYLYRPT